MTFRNTKWTTKDGRVLRVRDMDTSHIINCMKLIERATTERVNQEITLLCGGPGMFLSGEAAIACLDASLDRLEGIAENISEYLMEVNQAYRSMYKELNFRKAWPLSKEPDQENELARIAYQTADRDEWGTYE